MPAAALGASGTHGGDASPTLMAVPDAHATLMPVPGGAPATDTHSDDHSDDGMGGMAGMDSHSDASMPSVATPDAPQRHLVLAGFAAVNALVLGAAASMRRKGGKHRPPRTAAPARSTRNASAGGAA